MIKKIISIFTVLALFLQTAKAQKSFGSLEEVWRYADAHNVTIRNASFELYKVLAAKQQSYEAFLPQVSANSSFTTNLNLQTTLVPAIIVNPNATPDAVVPVQFGQKYITQVGITAQLDILNLQTWFNVKITEQNKELSKATLANTKKTVYQQLASQYYSYILMKEAARLAENSLAISDSVYLSIQHKFDEGTVNESNLDLAKINKARAEQTLINAQYQAKTALNNLKTLLDFSINDSILITGVLNEIKINEQNALQIEDPAVKQAYYQAKVAMSRLKAANANFAPTLSLSYSNLAQQNDNTFEPFTGTGATWYPASFWSLKATWNIFTGGTRWLQTKQNKITYQQSQMQYEAIQKQSEITDDNLQLAYRKTQALLEKSESIMKLSFDNYTHVSERYEAGIASLDDRLNAFSDYINYQNQYLNSLSEALVQVYQLKIRQQQ